MKRIGSISLVKRQSGSKNAHGRNRLTNRKMTTQSTLKNEYYHVSKTLLPTKYTYTMISLCYVMSNCFMLHCLCYVELFHVSLRDILILGLETFNIRCDILCYIMLHRALLWYVV